MIWKIFFAISAILVVLINIIGFNSNYNSITTIQYFFSVLTSIDIAFVLGIFYSLGWKKQLFSKKAANIFLTLLLLTMVLNTVFLAFNAYSIAYAHVQNSIVAMIGSIIGSSIVTIIANLFLIPFYVGFYKYKKNFDNLTQTDKSYWKLFSLYCIAVLIAFVASALIKYTHFPLYNFMDYLIIFSCIYEIVFLVGFAWNKKIFNKLFWQISAILYILSMPVAPFFMSETFNKDFHITEIISGNTITIILTVALQIVYLYIIYNYAFAKEKSIDIKP